ncbi:MAG: hypothetical protein OXN97_01125 [Bryobacterales bacterium]|nr:hypothetical protein [Bryobacterales bacterium]MDE0625904.1 hypothetical protein [Bryobacterales bacterium]
MLVAADGRRVDPGVEAGLHLSATCQEAEKRAQLGRNMLQAAPSVVRGAPQDERIDALRGKPPEGRRTVVTAEEVKQAEGGAAVMAHCRGGETSHLLEELEIGTYEEFAGTRIRNLQPTAFSEVRGQGPHQR